MSKKDIETFRPTSRAEWRSWLIKNHESKQSIWLVCYKVSTKVPSVNWSEAVDEALCFGWIDSTKKTIDKERYMQYYSRRKPTSTWSKINKDKIERLIQDNMMAEAGLKCIEIAKENGTWLLMDDVEKLIVPEDLKLALTINENALQFFQSQSKSHKKSMLFWVVIAKRRETRVKRIKEIVACAIIGKRPKQFV